MLAKLGFRTARALHRVGLHEVVNLAKNSGLKRAFLKSGVDKKKDPPPMSEADRQWTAAHFADDVSALADLVGRDLKTLWGIA
ncbi:MAG: hypothetical protein AAF745_11750 [Planctomycetota bacterium]